MNDETGGATWRIGADIGGTFTDILALGPNRSFRRIKVLSTPADYSLAISKSIHEEFDGEARRATRSFVHGTTIATNTILEEKAPSIALRSDGLFGYHGHVKLNGGWRSRPKPLANLKAKPCHSRHGP